MKPNILLITLDQFRADALSVAGHPVVLTPNLDLLAKQSVRFKRHYSQSAPCAPGRASLYTGMYQMNHRVVFNGTPLEDRFDNIARLGQRAGYEPALFGYTDSALDPRTTDNPKDSRLFSYEGVLPGFTVELDLVGAQTPWLENLSQHGYDLPRTAPPGTDTSPIELGFSALRSEPERPAELSISAFLTDQLCRWIESRDDSWFAHASYMRPHPPYAAAGIWNDFYDPDDVDMPIIPATTTHPFHTFAMVNSYMQSPSDEAGIREMRAKYYGMVSEVDDQLGRIWDKLIELDQWKNTIIILTSDHGDQLGDHGLKDKGGYFEESYHVPAFIRDPNQSEGWGSVVNEFTENIDIFPTLAHLLDQPVPLQCDGLPLTDFLAGRTPHGWRDAATWEFDWRAIFINDRAGGACLNWPADRSLEQQNLTVRRTDTAAYVQFGDGSWLAFDLVTDPTWRTYLSNTDEILALAQSMLVWHTQNFDRTMTGLLIQDGGVGRWPTGVSWHSPSVATKRP